MILVVGQGHRMRQFSANKCICSETSIFCCLLIDNEADITLSNFYGNYTGSESDVPGGVGEQQMEGGTIVVQPVRINNSFPGSFVRNGSASESEDLGQISPMNDSTVLSSPMAVVQPAGDDLFA